MIRRGCYQPKRQLLGGVRTRKENAPFHGAQVSLWLGHADLRTTEMYVRASPAEKLDILESNTPPSIRPGTFLGVRDSLMELLGGT